MHCNAMLQSVLALALMANMGAAIPVSTTDEVSDISIPKVSTTKPSSPSAGSSAGSSGGSGKLLNGLGAAGGLVGSVAGLGNLVNGIFHEPAATPGATSCGFFHKLINDCPAPAATPAPTPAAAAARSVEEREPALGGLLGGPAQDSTCGFFHKLIHDCPEGNPTGSPSATPSAIDTMPADPISPPDAALPTTTVTVPQRRSFNA